MQTSSPVFSPVSRAPISPARPHNFWSMVVGRPLSKDGGVSVEEADMPMSELSTTYVPDAEKEPVHHGH